MIWFLNHSTHSECLLLQLTMWPREEPIRFHWIPVSLKTSSDWIFILRESAKTSVLKHLIFTCLEQKTVQQHLKHLQILQIIYEFPSASNSWFVLLSPHRAICDQESHSVWNHNIIYVSDMGWTNCKYNFLQNSMDWWSNKWAFIN